MPDTPNSPLPDKDSEERFLTREEAIAELRALWEEGLASGIDQTDEESFWREVGDRIARKGG